MQYILQITIIKLFRLFQLLKQKELNLLKICLFAKKIVDRLLFKGQLCRMSHDMLARCTMRKLCAYTIRDFANLEKEYNINKKNLKPAMRNLKFHFRNLPPQKIPAKFE